MDWTAVRVDTMARVQGSRLRREIRYPDAALGGLSIEDFIHDAIQEFNSSSPPPLLPNLQSREAHQALVEQITQITIRRIESYRRQHCRRKQLLQQHQIIYPPIDDSDDTDQALRAEEMMQVLENDQEARAVMITIYEGLAHRRDNKEISKITGYDLKTVQNAKKRARAKIRKYSNKSAAQQQRGS